VARGLGVAELRRSTRAQVFRVRDGLVVDIRDDVDDHHVADSAV